ncbi:DUF2281 domain-containing protein [Aphanothece sacrum]|uniref:DUF2281 domain-containing protein n=1 Tax=Aphanothece sacrum FPU1 TaxID=1920663 RepID=A0A401IDP9_APHSA|nr:DUF2281 domain-containing protein [Aphanothece sacrum]GBF79344.1 hypothetical protein AsFPU1_0737 [Aphanothece sacrum FPU1]GBF86846.1 hypothetical protein AsFPU3_3919 [Aphanothece sacrum FPU3]
MTIKKQLIQEIEDIPDSLLAQLLDYLLFLKKRHIEEDITEEERANIIASEFAYQSGDYLTLEEYEASQN